MSNRGNIFANFEHHFEFGTQQEIEQLTVDAADELTQELLNTGGISGEAIYVLLIMGAQIGTMADGVLSEKEKHLIKSVFDTLYDDIDINSVYADIENYGDIEYDTLTMIVQLGNSVAIPLLGYILGMTYIDGKLRDDIGQELENIFSMNLLQFFIESGQEEVPAPQVRLTETEGEIVKFIEESHTMMKAKDLRAHFSYFSLGELDKALNSLCEKDILQYTDNIIGGPYYLLYGTTVKTEQPVIRRMQLTPEEQGIIGIVLDACECFTIDTARPKFTPTDIVKQLGFEFSVKQVNNVLEHLSEDGALKCTIENNIRYYSFA